MPQVAGPPHPRLGNDGEDVSAPDIPTIEQAGLPGFYVSVWHRL